MSVHLHTATVWATLWMCAAVAAVVFGVMIHSVATFRGGTGGVGRRIAEILWTIVPMAIMAASAVPAMRTAMSPSPTSLHLAHSQSLLSITGAAGYNADRK
jgi:heme/copper-type cytochrome/quinol oxidase subunit 2